MWPKPTARLLVLAVIWGTLVGLACPAQAQEGYDPMRQISSQIVHPNLLIVMDRSGSLSFAASFDSNYDDWNYDGSNNGHMYWAYSEQGLTGFANITADFTVSDSNYEQGYGSLFQGVPQPSSGAGQGYWIRAGVTGTYSGLIRSYYPGLVYVLGNPGWSTGQSITISGLSGSDKSSQGFILCSDPQQSGWNPAYWYFTVRQANGPCSYTFTRGYSALTITAVGADAHSIWYFVPPSRMAIFKNTLGNSVTLYGATASPTGTDQDGKPYYQFDPSGGPVNGAYYDMQAGQWINWSPTTQPPAGDPSFTKEIDPANLIGNTSSQINWGLVDFHGGSAEELVRVSPIDNAQATNVSILEAYMSTVATSTTINGTTYWGLNPYNGTPTSLGLDEAKYSLYMTYKYGGANNTQDPGAACGRLYGVVLITDGESNTCNPNGNEWSQNESPNGACGETDLPTIAYYPPGRTDELFLDESDATSGCQSITSSGPPIHVQTFAIGVSSDVTKDPSAVCELNYDAYFGRTDASATDAGVNWKNDSRLPQNTSGSTTLSNFDTNLTQGNYAFFASTTASFAAAFNKIVANMGAGDYTTASPSVSAASPSTSGNVAFLASAQYPGWMGHLYAFDLTKTAGTSGYQLWDAGQSLENQSVGTNAASGGRAIYTWQANGSQGYSLVEVTQANLSTLQSINPNLTANAVDFIRGNDGTLSNNKRSWLLGAIINSTPAVIGAPAKWTQNLLDSHATFQATYSNRHPLVWVGSDDGMLHAFDIVDGSEVLALLPPEFLGNEIRMYNVFKANPQAVVGEPAATYQHLYGVAASPRYADVEISSGSYSTVLYLSEGPGHDLGTSTTNYVTAIDVTHPYPGRSFTYNGQSYAFSQDPNYTSSAPVTVLWSNQQNTLSWSLPAIGAFTSSTWVCQLGSGFNPQNTFASGNKIAPTLTDLNAATGKNLKFSPFTLSNAGSGYVVGNQTFAHSVVWEPSAVQFYEDNLVTQGVQADLNGNLWLQTQGSGGPGTPAASISVGANQPIYYSPAVASVVGTGGDTYSLYAFASGSFYESSSKVTGPNIGTSPNFVPTIYIYAYDQTTKTWTHFSIPIQNIPNPSVSGTYLTKYTQPTASPLLLVPAANNPTGTPFALFLVYDPNAYQCAGASYLVHINFNVNNLAGTTISANNVTFMGSGAASGFAMSNNQVLVAKSGVGQGSQASLMSGGAQWQIGPGSEKPTWWIQLK